MPHRLPKKGINHVVTKQRSVDVLNQNSLIIYKSHDEKQEKIIDGLLSCEWNTFMCCWTGNVTVTSDVCRVLDYPDEGSVVEYPRDSEGNVSW